MNKKHSNPSKILIIKPSALGDIALTLPVLASLRSSFPDAHITWFIRPEFAPILENIGGLDDVIIFHRRRLGKWWCNPKQFSALMRLFAELRKGRFDLVLDLQGLFRTAFFAWLTGSSRRFGMKTAREFATLFYTDKIDPDADSVHVIDYHRKILAAAGARTITNDSNLFATAQAAERVRKLLQDRNAPLRDYVVLITGSAHASKCWPVEKFAALADRISERFDVDVIAAGVAAEKPTVALLVELAGAPIVDMAGQTDIGTLVALLAGARLVVSNDTGPAHIAYALDAPVIIIFGPTNPSRIRPYDKPHAVAAVDPETRRNTIDSNDPRYRIDAVSVESVFAEVEHHLKDHGL
ncbi:MAG: glycosyltransferase family 9 protein [Planctomycetes bacterium]|nr:glycosyltransferase family 9 protein [Planctomycetota bacterium]